MAEGKSITGSKDAFFKKLLDKSILATTIDFFGDFCKQPSPKPGRFGKEVAQIKQSDMKKLRKIFMGKILSLKEI